MTYTLHYADEKTIRRQLTTLYWRARIPGIVIRLLLLGIVTTIVYRLAGVTAALIVACLPLCLWVAAWCRGAKFYVRGIVLPPESELLLSLQESGMIGESQGVKSFRRWSDLDFPRQFLPQELLCLSNRADGSLVMLPVAELSEEERQALVTDIRQFISAAKAGTSGEPLPPPEGYGEAFSLSPAAIKEGADVLILQLFPWVAWVNVLAVILLWALLPVTPFLALLTAYVTPTSVVTTGVLIGIVVYLLIFRSTRVLHPGTQTARYLRRFMKDDTWSLSEDGSTLLRRKPSGSWHVIPLSFYTRSLRGAHSRVMMVGSRNGMLLPPEVLDGAAIPPPLPAPRRHPVLTLLLAPLPAVFLIVGAIWFFLSLNASLDEKYGPPAWAQEQYAMIDEQAKAQVNAAAPEEVEPEVRALIAQWQLQEQLEKQWEESDALERGVMNLNEDEKPVNFFSFITPLNLWNKRFPEQTQAAISSFPESVQSDVRDYLYDEDEESEDAEEEP